MRPGLVAVLLVGACGTAAGPTPDALTGDAALLVAGASDLRPAFEEIGELFTAETGHEVIFDFGSSGQLAQRIIEGAPVDVYASANVSFIDEVLESGVGDPETKATYAFGRITLWSMAAAWRGWSDLADLVSDPDITFLAIANPEHAPYGVAAKEALLSVGLWEIIEPKLVFGENISDTQRLADTGDADAAIVALSLAIAAGERGDWLLIDEALHEPLEQALVVVTDDPGRVEVATAFAAFVNQPAGREVMVRFGFVLPGENSGTG
ncbi:MAG: molybdate ABC transporter substrate-binding protein [Acidimicrobiia bacterium]